MPPPIGGGGMPPPIGGGGGMAPGGPMLVGGGMYGAGAALGAGCEESEGLYMVPPLCAGGGGGRLAPGPELPRINAGGGPP